MARVKNSDIPIIKEEDESMIDVTWIFEKVSNIEKNIKISKERRAPKLRNLTNLIRSLPTVKRSEEDGTDDRATMKHQNDSKLTDDKKVVFDMNWNHRRSIAGYYGCGDCELCKVSKFGEKFKVEHSGDWYKIKETIDCNPQNVLYLATCVLCKNQPQYAGSTKDMRERIIKHKADTKNIRPREKPEDELSRHFFETHGGWYAEGVLFQIVKIVEQGEFKDMKEALESSAHNMMAQLSLYEPGGMNQRKEDKIARKNSAPPLNLKILPNGEHDITAKVSRWSRLDYYKNKAKKEELTDVAHLLLQHARSQEAEEIMKEE